MDMNKNKNPVRNPPNLTALVGMLLMVLQVLGGSKARITYIKGSFTVTLPAMATLIGLTVTTGCAVKDLRLQSLFRCPSHRFAR